MQDMDVPRFVARWMAERIARQNIATREECEKSGVAEYIPFAPERAGIRIGVDSSAVYESWATSLLKYATRALSAKTKAQTFPIDEEARIRALDALEFDEATVDRIVEMARDMLGADAASLDVIERDRQVSLATAGSPRRDMPRSEAIANTTIQRPGAHVIEDLDADPAYRDSSWTAEADHVRFYAGYPLEAPGGERVGALCVMNRSPRQFTADETATLRDLALRAQQVLWARAS
jgi:GAF domain-containing protein